MKSPIFKKIMEHYIDEAEKFGEEEILGESFDPHTMMVYKKLLKACVLAHEVYHISKELDEGYEPEDTNRDKKSDTKSEADNHKGLHALMGGNPVRPY